MRGTGNVAKNNCRPLLTKIIDGNYVIKKRNIWKKKRFRMYCFTNDLPQNVLQNFFRFAYLISFI